MSNKEFEPDKYFCGDCVHFTPDSGNQAAGLCLFRPWNKEMSQYTNRQIHCENFRDVKKHIDYKVRKCSECDHHQSFLDSKDGKRIEICWPWEDMKRKRLGKFAYKKSKTSACERFQPKGT